MTNLAVPALTAWVDDERLAQEITLLAGQINAANHRLLKLIAQFDERKAWSCSGAVRSCAHWLNWKCGIAMGAAREKVRVANSLAALPEVDAAFARGEISYSKVRAITRIAAPENEDFLLRIARYGTASHVERIVGKYRSVQQAGDKKAKQDQEERRKLVYYQDSDGMWVIHAQLTQEDGALLVKAIEAIAAQQDAPATSPEPEDREANSGSFTQLLQHSRADALAKLVEHFLASGGENASLKNLKGNERCQVMLHVDITTLQQKIEPANTVHRHCNTDNRRWLAPDTARRLACDASLVTVLEDQDGKVLNIGRRSRTVPANIRHALALRDSTCRFPGCCESRYVDAHHIRHWCDGGETSLDNLVLLCRFHHRLLHSGGFTIHIEGNGLLNFVENNGKELPACIQHQFPRVSAETSARTLRAIAPHVDSRTCVTRWTGEDCDYAMAVDALLQRDRRPRLVASGEGSSDSSQSSRLRTVVTVSPT